MEENKIRAGYCAPSDPTPDYVSYLVIDLNQNPPHIIRTYHDSEFLKPRNRASKIDDVLERDREGFLVIKQDLAMKIFDFFEDKKAEKRYFELMS
jgi:hypothetical protein